MGRMLGWHFNQQGHDITIYEKDQAERPTSAAYIAASMLAPQSERPESSEEVWKLALESLKIWPGMLESLGVPYGLDGALVVAHPKEHNLLDRLEASLHFFDVPAFRRLGRGELAELEPDLAHRFDQCVYLEQEGWLDNRTLLKALETRCGTLSYNSMVNPHSLAADLVMDCRGMGADDLELRGVRGEIIRIYAPSVSISRPIRLLHPKYSLYISPRSHHHYVIGATQLESEFKGKVTVKSALELLSAAYTIHEGFEEAEIIELGSALRPAYPDNDPRIFWNNGVLIVNGLYRHGYLVAPAIVNKVCHEVQQRCKSS